MFLRDGIVLDESDPRINVVTTNTTSSLTITEIMSDESGEYRCRFTNSIGSDEISISITVLGE